LPIRSYARGKIKPPKIWASILNTTFLNLPAFVLIAIESAPADKKTSVKMLKRITRELKRHAPFTASGALSGILIMLVIVFGHIPSSISHIAFYTLHPLHVVLSALATTAMYAKYKRCKLWSALVIGWTGSIGIATISDVIIPYLGASLLHVPIEFHIPFIDKWWVNLAALIGVAICYRKPTTKMPHFGHVLLSTWASLFYFTAFGIADWIPLLPFIFLFLFLAVWIPCCTSDIVYPLLFVRKEKELPSQ
jgi:hypothetical protein